MMRSASAQQPRAVSQPYSAHDHSLQDIAESSGPTANGSLRRKGSFNFLRRSKSRDRSTSTSSTPHRKLSKKERSRKREEEMMQEQIPSQPPKIPHVPRQPELQSFGGEDERQYSAAIMSDRSGGSFQHRLAQKASSERVGADMYRGMPVPPVPPIPPIPGLTTMNKSSYVDAFPRTESMTHRGRYSYASSAISTINSPRKIRRRKDPTPFNILVVGARGSGKTSFLNFLRTSLAMPPWKQRQQSRDDGYMITPTASAANFPNFPSHSVETEIQGEKIGVTLWDSEGLEANVVDIQIQKLASFIESKFEETFNEENQVARAPGFRDTHIHCVFHILDPARLDANLAASQKATTINGVKAKANSFAKGRPEPPPSGLDENLDLNVMRGLRGKTTVVPVIAKADTITSAHMVHLKRAVWESLRKNGLENLEGLSQEDDDDGSDTASENDGGNGAAENNHNSAQMGSEGDKFSMTSVLDSPSDTDSEFSASDFDLAKPGKPAKTARTRTPSNQPATRATAEPPILPLSIISPDPFEPDVVGRKFPWGFADPLNAEHCDFVKLRDSVFTEWRAELREASRELWYEGWRTSRLNKKARRDGAFLGDARIQVWAQ